jgi:hypothetical protein
MQEAWNYDSMDYLEEEPQARFPEWVLGYRVWAEMATHLHSPEAFSAFLDGIASVRREDRPDGSLPNLMTRVFVSHKQQDRDEALRVAWLTNQAGHYFWLDILDPVLASGRLSPFQTAAAIEMALLNCTHVIALITPQSGASRWIPYEYGRVKEPTLYALNVASWLHPQTPQPIPEYLYLGALTKTEPDILRWLSPHRASLPWSGPPTHPLP